MSLKDAEIFYDNYWKTYDQVRIMQDGQVNSCVELGFVTDLCFGRQRYFVPSAEDILRMDEFGLSIEKIREKASAQAMNFACQSTGATIIKVALIKMHHWIARNPQHPTKLRLAVHDSIIVTCKVADKAVVSSALAEMMELAAKEVVPGIEIPVDLDVIENHTATRTFTKPTAYAA